VLLAASGGWYFSASREIAARPAFVLLAPVASETAARPDSAADTTAEPAVPPTAADLRPTRRDTARRLAASPPPPPAPVTGAPGRPTERAQATRPPADSAQRRADSVLAQVVIPSTQPVVAPPPPPPVVRDTQPVTPAVDPEVRRRAAEAVLQRGLGRFVAALQEVRLDDLGVLYPPGDGFRSSFLNHMERYKPTIRAGGLGNVTVGTARAEAPVTISFQWRANFGVERRGEGRFVVFARDDGSGSWQFGGVRLTESFP